MAIKHHSLFWLHGVVCSQFFHGINCLALCVAATERSLGTLAWVETSSRGSRGSWCRARWRVSVCRICSGHKGSIHKTFGWCLRDQARSPTGLSDKTCDTGAWVGYKSPSPVLWPELLRSSSGAASGHSAEPSEALRGRLQAGIPSSWSHPCCSWLKPNQKDRN